MSEKGTEQATPQRKKKARDDGDTVRSRELLSATAMLGGVLALGAVSPQFVKGWARAYYGQPERIFDRRPFGRPWTSGRCGACCYPYLLPMATIMLAAFVPARC